MDIVLEKAKPLIDKIPPSVERFVRSIYVQQKFKTELQLIEGRHRNENKHPSVIHFSFNRAATQYVKSILRRCAVENWMVPAAIHDYAFHTNFPFLDHLSAKEMAKYQHIFKAQGYLYSVFGGMIEGIPHLEKYKVVLVARDPRDILVSGYYATAYSHVVPSKTVNKHQRFVKRRAKARELTIDEFVILESDALYDQFVRYKSLLLEEYPYSYLTTYEHMVSDFEGWLNGLVGYCKLNVSKSLFESLVQENERLTPRREDIQRHLRKGQPGDYREKLKIETIEFLNAKFAPIVADFGYTTTIRDAG